jgi:glutathione S-transferase
MMTRELTLISHPLCPYVQRAAIALAEKGVAYERIDIDLACKPDWFLALSPLGKTPVLKVGDRALFESSAILEYLDEIHRPRLHPGDPLTRAEHRAWIEFGSSVLNDIAGFYVAPDPETFAAKAQVLTGKFGRMEQVLGDGPYFAGEHLSTPSSARCSAISTPSTASMISAFSRASRKLPHGAEHWRRAHQFDRRCRAISRRACWHSFWRDVRIFRAS